MKWLTEILNDGQVVKYNLDRVDVIEISKDKNSITLVSFLNKEENDESLILRRGCTNFDYILRIVEEIK